MLLATLGMLTIVGLMAAILSKRVAPMVALIAFPVIASLCAGFGLQTGKFMLAGIEAISGVIGMFVFAILFFGVMTDAGMLQPLIAWLLRVVGRRPSRITQQARRIHDDPFIPFPRLDENGPPSIFRVSEDEDPVFPFRE